MQIDEKQADVPTLLSYLVLVTAELLLFLVGLVVQVFWNYGVLAAIGSVFDDGDDDWW